MLPTESSDPNPRYPPVLHRGIPLATSGPYGLALARALLVLCIEVQVKSIRLQASSEVRFGERLGPRPSGSFRTTHPLRAVSLECARGLLFQSSLIRSKSSQSITIEPMHTLPSP